MVLTTKTSGALDQVDVPAQPQFHIYEAQVSVTFCYGEAIGGFIIIGCNRLPFNEIQTVSLCTSKALYTLEIPGHVREVQRIE